MKKKLDFCDYFCNFLARYFRDVIVFNVLNQNKKHCVFIWFRSVDIFRQRISLKICQNNEKSYICALFWYLMNNQQYLKVIAAVFFTQTDKVETNEVEKNYFVQSMFSGHAPAQKLSCTEVRQQATPLSCYLGGQTCDTTKYNHKCHIQIEKNNGGRQVVLS